MRNEGIRRCPIEERERILEIVNAAAEAYRGVIPDDCWREPYMPSSELDHEIAAGVTFWGYEVDGSLIGVMGVQPMDDVDLIRHAYVMPGSQRRGVGGALLRKAAAAQHKTDARGHLGRRRLGDPVLPSPRLRARRGRAHRVAAEALLDHPGPPDRDVGVLANPSVEFRHDLAARVRRRPTTASPGSRA